LFVIGVAKLIEEQMWWVVHVKKNGFDERIVLNRFRNLNMVVVDLFNLHTYSHVQWG
jgi:hypothetical protein